MKKTLKEATLMTLATGGVAVALAFLAVVALAMFAPNTSALAGVLVVAIILLAGVCAAVLWPVWNNPYTRFWRKLGAG